MKEIVPFKFERATGIVWVCDIEKSSSFLNDPGLVEDIKSFLPRFYYVSKLMVETFGGEFFKWTGDGFLAFFKVDPEQDLSRISKNVFEGAFHLSAMTRITQMGLQMKKKVKIRHGITFEEDALLMKIDSDSENNKVDIIGKAVVLAFRLSSIEADWPSIVTVSELIEEDDYNYIKWEPTKEDLLRYFKGEEFGIEKIKIYKKREVDQANWGTEFEKASNKIISKLKKIRSGEDERLIQELIEKLDSGPDWCREISVIEKKAFQPIVEAFNKLINEFKEIKK